MALLRRHDSKLFRTLPAYISIPNLEVVVHLFTVVVRQLQSGSWTGCKPAKPKYVVAACTRPPS